MNLLSYVDNPFKADAKFNFDKFRDHVYKAMHMMDDIIDLELEKVEQIIGKIAADPEDLDVRRVELELWKKIREMARKGRRTGLGITAEGDMLAALGLRYGTQEAIDFAVEVQKCLALAAYGASVKMAAERGAFPVYDAAKEVNNPMIARIREADPELYEEMTKVGRRNIAMLTIAPTGTTSLISRPLRASSRCSAPSTSAAARSILRTWTPTSITRTKRAKSSRSTTFTIIISSNGWKPADTTLRSWRRSPTPN